MDLKNLTDAELQEIASNDSLPADVREAAINEILDRFARAENVPLEKINEIRKAMESGKSGGSTEAREKIIRQIADWNRKIIQSKQKIGEKSVVAEKIISPFRPNIPVEPVREEQPEKGKAAPPQYVAGEGVKLNLPHTPETALADREITKMAAREGREIKGPVNVGLAAEKGVKGFLAGIARQVSGQSGGAVEPKEVIEQTKEFYAQPPEEQKRQMGERFTPVRTQRRQAGTLARQIQQPPRQPRVSGGGGLLGEFYKARATLGSLPGNFFQRVWTMVRGGGKAAGTVAKVTGTTTAAVGFVSKAKILISKAGPVAAVVTFVGGKLLNGVKGLLSGLGVAFKGRSDRRDVVAGLGTTLENGVGAAMTVGFFLGGSGPLGLVGILGLSLAGVFLLTLITVTGVAGSFYQPAENDAPVMADVPPPVVTITKSHAPTANKIDFSDIPAGGITYNVNFSSSATVTGGRVTDTVTVISQGGSTTQSILDQAYTGSQLSYTLAKGLIKDNSVVINEVTVTGTANGKAFTDITSSEIIIGSPPVTIFSCPVLGGAIICTSANNPANLAVSCHHCSQAYQAANGSAVCNWPGNAQAIDVSGSAGQAVYLPAINKQKVSWQLLRQGNDVSYTYNGVYQRYREFKAPADGTEYVLQIHHLIADDSLAGKTTLVSGDMVGKLAGFDGNKSSPHAHIQLSRGGVWVAADSPTLNFCK